MDDFKKKFQLPQRYQQSAYNSVWSEYMKLANEYNPINLGQGFPDYPPSEYVINALAEVANNSDDKTTIHQYTREFGHPRLIAALSRLYSKLIGRPIDQNTEILVTLGAYNGIFAAIMGHVDNGDEVIIFEPYFKCYEHNVINGGGIPKFIPLQLKDNGQDVLTSADWIYDQQELENLFNERTKLIILNTPHNPIGKVFTYQELNFIADLCRKWNVLCVSDEVYEWLVYTPNTHIRIASLPGMWERTITIGSAGKTFGVTGWKIGWAYGPDYLIGNLQVVLSNCVSAGNTILQEAVAVCFEKELNLLHTDDSYFNSLSKQLIKKRDFMCGILREIGMRPTIPQGGYFIIADWSSLEPLIDLNSEHDQYKDYRFTKWMIKHIGIQGIPPSAFYCDKHKHLGEYFVRYCFVKKDKSLEKAAKILKQWINNTNKSCLKNFI